MTLTLKFQGQSLKKIRFSVIGGLIDMGWKGNKLTIHDNKHDGCVAMVG